MSWMQRLCETYDNAHNKIGDYNDDAILLPFYHTTMTCDIEVTLDENGCFLQAKPSEEKKIIIVPCTESSAGRTGKRPKAHPLSDKLQYVAGDFSHYGGEVTRGFKADPEEPFRQLYEQLTAWSNEFPDNYKLRAVKCYLEKKRLMKDLIEASVLRLDEKGMLLKNDNDATVGWHVHKKGDPTKPLWNDEDIHNAWVAYYENRKLDPKLLCFISGRADAASAEKHPKKILKEASNAKIISSEDDEDGFTFLGRFITAEEACAISAVASQKMHNALKWLIDRQGYHKGTLNIVTWAVSTKDVPNPMDETDPYDYDDIEEDYNTAQAFGKALSARLAGYRTKLSSTEGIVVLAFDAATSGRAALTYYRELTGCDFLDRLERWYARHEWLYPKPDKKRGFYIQVRSPEQIAKDIFEYKRDDDKQKKTDDNIIRSVVQRLLPCIIEGQRVPFDLVVSARNRASRPTSFKNKEDWENTLSTACALYRGYYYKNIKEEYSMSLDPNRTSRDYLYGRLLAVAESLEKSAHGFADEGRSTTAERYMQQFAERPFNTWRTIELSLSPYIARLQSNAPGLKKFYTDKLDEIQCLFNPDDYKNNEPLTGEFLLGYHCQRRKNYESGNNSNGAAELKEN